MFGRLLEQRKNYLIHQISPVRNLQNGKVKRIVICAAGNLAAGQKPVTARRNSSHESCNFIRGLLKRKAAVIKWLLKQNRTRTGKPREVLLERQNNIAADAGNATSNVNKLAGSKNWKTYRWQEQKKSLSTLIQKELNLQHAPKCVTSRVPGHLTKYWCSLVGGHLLPQGLPSFVCNWQGSLEKEGQTFQFCLLLSCFECWLGILQRGKWSTNFWKSEFNHILG